MKNKTIKALNVCLCKQFFFLFPEYHICNLGLYSCKQAVENYKIIYIFPHSGNSDFTSQTLIKNSSFQPRLVDLSWPMPQLCSETSSCGGIRACGIGPGKSDVYEQDNT